MSVCYHTVLIPVALELKIGHFILFSPSHYFGYSSSFAFKFENKLAYMCGKSWDSNRNCVEFIYFFNLLLRKKKKKPSQLPPHPIPLGHPSAPALSTLSHASTLN